MPTAHLGFRLLVPLAFLCSLHVATGQPGINVCGVDLRIGMAKDSVLRAASLACEVKRYRGGADDRWCARPAEIMNSGLPPYAACNDLEFASGLLSSVEKEVGQTHDGNAAGIVDRVFSFLRGAEDVGQSVTVTPGSETEYAGLRFRTINLRVGQRELILSVTQPIGSTRGVSEVRLTELLQAAAPRSRKQ